MLFYDITRALTRVALGYAYEKGYVTGTPDLDSAVHYYESSHQYIVSHLANRSEEIKDIPVDDEAAERLEAFEEIGITRKVLPNPLQLFVLPLPHGLTMQPDYPLL